MSAITGKMIGKSSCLRLRQQNSGQLCHCITLKKAMTTAKRYHFLQQSRSAG
jgi:hypothetical protein